MKTDICRKLGIEYPIFAFTHCRDVVVAVSKAGGIGVLGAVGYSPEQLKEELDWIDEHIGDYPYGVDTVIPQKYEGMDEKDPEQLLESLQKLNENALSKDAIVYDLDDQEFKDIDFSARGRCEIEKASDELNDEDANYFVI